MSTKYVYLFSEGNATMRNLLGGKGANLAEMTSLGMPVPQGFTLPTEACTRYYDDGQTIGADIQEQIDAAYEGTIACPCCGKWSHFDIVDSSPGISEQQAEQMSGMEMT